MYRLTVVCCLLLSSLLIRAQQQFRLEQLPKIYQQREALASVNLKNVLSVQRKLIADRKLPFTVANTSVSEMKLEAVTGVLPINRPEADKLNLELRAQKLSPDVLELVQKYRLPACWTSSKTYDSRAHNYVPPIRLQHCGNCWSYSANGALECSYIKVNGISNPATVDLSERQLVACSGGGTCSGGWPFKIYQWLKASGAKVMNDADAPDNGTDHPCPATPASAHVQLADWGLVDASAGLYKIASVAKIKEAICTYGSVSVCLMATPLFQNYADGVFDETPSNYSNPDINHAVVLVGWDDNKGAWLLRNSWNTSWGMGGYCWIKYNTNNVGFGAIWCIAKKNLIRVVTPIKTIRQ